jgi:hypothetical protein
VSENSASFGYQISPSIQRRMSRLKREIALLEGMKDTLWRKSFRYSVFFLCGLITIFFICAVTLGWLGLSRSATYAVSALASVGCWWLARYSTIFGVTLGVLGLPILLAMTITGIFSGYWIDLPSRGSSKTSLKLSKIEIALKKRNDLVAAMEPK